MRRPSCDWVGANVILVTLRLAGTLDVQQTPPPVHIGVAVTAEDSRQMREAVQSLERHGDPFLSALAPDLAPLTTTMANLGRTFTVGPLTAREASIVDLSSYFKAHQRPNGAIRMQVRRTLAETEPDVYRFSEASFLSMLAAIAKGPTVQMSEQQSEQLLWLGRTVLDLNWQAGGIIPARNVFTALSREFRDKTAGTRLVGIVRSMTDSGLRYELVPRRRLRDFEQRAEPGFLIPASGSEPGTIKLKYGESLYTTRADHLVWSFLRMFAGDNNADWAERAMARERAQLGRDVLDFLEAQVLMDGIDAMWSKLTAIDPGLEEIPLGSFRSDGPLALLIKGAPGILRKPSPASPEFSLVSVRAKRVPDLKIWIDQQTLRWQSVLDR